MFPLGSVLVPGMVLPLHVFEPRYRALARDVTSGAGEFGVTLIERGSEVGGGDVRTDVGTVARVLEHEEFDDGRWGIVAVGVRRIRVREWLDDDPYPRALVDPWPDDPSDPVELEHRLEQVVEELRSVLAMAAELGEVVAPATLEIPDDPGLASHVVANAVPAGAFDRQRLLTTPSALDRVELAAELLADARLLLGARLDDGPGPDLGDT